MTRNLLRNTYRHPTSWVFLAVLVAGLLMGIARARPPLDQGEILTLAVLSLLYLLVGTLVFLYVLGAGRPWLKILYITFQIILGTLILYLSRGNSWLVMVPLASHSVALFAPPLAAIPCLVITISIAWNTSRLLPDWVPFLQSALVFGSAVLFAAVFTEISIRDARRREEIERLNQQLEQANRRLQEYSTRIEELSAGQERSRLAREIHDGLGHYLTAMAVQARVVAALLEQDPPRAAEALAHLQLLIQESLAEVRRAVAAMRSDALHGQSLPEALEPLLEECRQSGLQAGLAVYGEPCPLPPADELALFRAAQEGLTNVRRHARAGRVEVQLEYWPQETILQVKDDGQGCLWNQADMGNAGQSFGLFGLGERLQLLQGRLSIATAPGAGFRLEARLPRARE